MKCPKCNRPNPEQLTANVLRCWWCAAEFPGTLPEHAREAEPAPTHPHDRSPGELVFNIGDWVGVPAEGGGYVRANVTGSAWNMHDGGTVTVWIPGTWLSTWNARDVLPWDEVPEHAQETEPAPEPRVPPDADTDAIREGLRNLATQPVTAIASESVERGQVVGYVADDAEVDDDGHVIRWPSACGGADAAPPDKQRAPTTGLTREPVGPPPETFVTPFKDPTQREVTITLGTGTYPPKHTRRERCVAPPTWAWVEREANDRVGPALYSMMGKSIAAMVTFSPMQPLTDEETEALEWISVWKLARLWQWLGAD